MGEILPEVGAILETSIVCRKVLEMTQLSGNVHHLAHLGISSMSNHTVL